MIKTANSLIKFSLILTLLMALAFSGHLFVLNTKELPLFDNAIVRCYLFNYLLTILTYSTLVIFKDKLSRSLGFVFMGGSMLKFGLFFLFFHPLFKSDGEMSRLEFASFFIPYAISLFLEVFFLVRTLTDKDSSTS